MKNLVTLLLTALVSLFPLAAFAQDGYFEANTQALIGDDVVTGEYTWAKGDWSGYGFADVAVNDDFYITDHEIRYRVAEPAFVSAELGYDRFGGTRFKIGVGANLNGVQFVNDNFVFLNVYAQKVLEGPEGDYIVGVAWETKPLQLSEDIGVYVTGFADLKKNAPDVFQPQVWLKFNGSPLEVGFEYAQFGDSNSVSGALKLKF